MLENFETRSKFDKNSRILSKTQAFFHKFSKTQAFFARNSRKLSQKLNVPEVLTSCHYWKIAQKIACVFMGTEQILRLAKRWCIFIGLFWRKKVPLAFWEQAPSAQLKKPSQKVKRCLFREKEPLK